jgi:hypothetical protein
VEDFPTRIPEFLEQATGRVRSMTVDRMARFIKIATLGLVATMLVFVAILFFFIGGRILGELVGDMELAYAIVGGLFLLVGVFFWFMRTRTGTTEESEWPSE